MSLIPYIEYTKQEAEEIGSKRWHYMSHLSNACASEDAHRTSAYAICLLEEGSLQLESDLFVYRTQAPAIFTIPPSAIRNFTDLGVSYDAKILFFRKEDFLEGQSDINYLERFEFFENKGQQVIPLNAGQYEKFKIYFDLIYGSSLEDTPNSASIVRSLIYIVLNEIDNAQQGQLPGQSPPPDKGAHVLAQFKNLLAEHFVEERRVSFYAEKMHLTTKYFSTLIKEVSGKTAGQWINEMLLLESKVRLRDKDRSISQIADDLNFSDPSHFGKFFKKNTGLRPLEYRR